jgi:hypothetical protein
LAGFGLRKNIIQQTPGLKTVVSQHVAFLPSRYEVRIHALFPSSVYSFGLAQSKLFAPNFSLLVFSLLCLHFKRVSLRIDHSIEMPPFLFHFDRCLIDAPGVGRGFRMRMATSITFGCIVLNPTGNGHMIDMQASSPPDRGSEASIVRTSARREQWIAAWK